METGSSIGSGISNIATSVATQAGSATESMGSGFAASSFGTVSRGISSSSESAFNGSLSSLDSFHGFDQSVLERAPSEWGKVNIFKDTTPLAGTQQVHAPSMSEIGPKPAFDFGDFELLTPSAPANEGPVSMEQISDTFALWEMPKSEAIQVESVAPEIIQSADTPEYDFESEFENVFEQFLQASPEAEMTPDPIHTQVETQTAELAEPEPASIQDEVIQSLIIGGSEPETQMEAVQIESVKPTIEAHNEASSEAETQDRISAVIEEIQSFAQGPEAAVITEGEFVEETTSQTQTQAQGMTETIDSDAQSTPDSELNTDTQADAEEIDQANKTGTATQTEKTNSEDEEELTDDVPQNFRDMLRFIVDEQAQQARALHAETILTDIVPDKNGKIQGSEVAKALGELPSAQETSGILTKSPEIKTNKDGSYVKVGEVVETKVFDSTTVLPEIKEIIDNFPAVDIAPDGSPVEIEDVRRVVQYLNSMPVMPSYPDGSA